MDEFDFDIAEGEGDSLGAAERGCGSRKKGGIYAEVPFDSPDGYPVEHFLIDPPIAIHDPKAYGVTPLGVKLLERDGVWHIFDWIGSKHYPNVQDFIREIGQLGCSRRLPKNLDFAKITSQSRIIFIHSRAYFLNNAEFYAAAASSDRISDTSILACPKSLEHHEIGDGDHAEMCLGMTNHDIEDGVLVEASVGRVVREMPGNWSYTAYERPPGFEPDYVPAVFMSLPVQRLAVIKGNGAKEAVEKAVKAGVEVMLWDE